MINYVKKATLQVVLLFGLCQMVMAQMHASDLKERSYLESLLSTPGQIEGEPYRSFRFSEGRSDQFTYHFVMGGEPCVYSTALDNIQGVDYVEVDPEHRHLYDKRFLVMLTLGTPVALKQLKQAFDAGEKVLDSVWVAPIYINGYNTYLLMEKLLAKISLHMRLVISQEERFVRRHPELGMDE